MKTTPLERRTPLRAKRDKPRRKTLPRCRFRSCNRIARIDDLCVPHAEVIADTRFSRWIRARDGRCTGAGILPGECDGPLAAAHIEGRANHSTRYDPDNVHALCNLRHHPMVDQHARHAAKARWATALLGPEGYHELMERAAITTPRAVAVQRALSWLEDDDEGKMGA